LFSEYWSFCFGPGNARPVTSKQFRNAMRELQQEKGFRLLIQTNQLGAQEAYYECLTLAD
jgi:putative DNA primase/helicase